MLNFNNFSTTRHILDLKMSLDEDLSLNRARRDLKVYLKTESPIFDKFDFICNYLEMNVPLHPYAVTPNLLTFLFTNKNH